VTRDQLARVMRIAGYAARHPREVLHTVEARMAQVPAQKPLPPYAALNLRIEPARAGRPTLNVLLPGMAMRAMSGGPNTAINLVVRMAHHGVPVRFISTDIAMDSDHVPLRRHFDALTGLRGEGAGIEIADASDRSVPFGIGANDVFFASAWWNVQMIRQAQHLTGPRRFLYIVQDFEPGLYPWSTEYALALETYGLDFDALICGRFLADYLFQSGLGRFAEPGFAQRCQVFEPAVDATRFYPGEPRGQGPRRLLFYARPTVALRNLFELGLEGLRSAAAAGVFDGTDWEFRFIGEQIPPETLAPGVQISAAPWVDYDGYAAMLRGSDIILSMMLSPHTSYPPIEMAACGGIAVTTTYANKTAQALRAISPNLIGIPPTQDGVVAGLREAVRRVGAGARDRSGVAVPNSWDETFRTAVPWAVGRFHACLAGARAA
jgi:O-antigen biosynthesis protein